MTSQSEERYLSPLEAAHRLGITSELLFQYTKRAFAKASGLRSLQSIERLGKTAFSTRELDAFDMLLAGPWPSPDDGRPAIPKAVVDHLRAESMGQCARCGSGIGLDNAHIRAWSESRSHHHANLIRICSGCHREHDAQNSLSTEQLLATKRGLIERTRANLMARLATGKSPSSGPRPNARFVGREDELRKLVDALRSERSVMITGAGGIGKTELLLQALAAAETGRSILWIDVELYRTAADVKAALQAALHQGGTACPEDAMPGRLDALQACVVFDGVERALLDDLDALEDTLVTLLDATAFTQIVVTSQIALHAFGSDARVRLGKLNAPTSRALVEALRPSDLALEGDDLTDLLEFCDGHALTLRLAAALRDHYGGAKRALQVVRAKGVSAIRIPTRSAQTRRTSLELCLQTAYEALSADARGLLWALAASPAGVLTHYIENGWLEFSDPIEALGELRRWHLVDLVTRPDVAERAQVASPIRAFAADVGRRDDRTAYDAMIQKLSQSLQQMVAMFEIRYADPDDTPYVIERYGQELPNFLHLLDLARADVGNADLGRIAISIIRAMMRYFFVRGLPEQGARVMHDASELALKIGKPDQASGLILQLVALAERADDDRLLRAGMGLADTLEAATDDIEVLADVALCRGMEAHRRQDHAASEAHARRAFEGYRSRLRAAVETEGTGDNPKQRVYDLDDMHNDMSHALGVLGGSLLAQNRPEEAGRAYRHSLEHQRGASVAVNRGQTLHQIGNCESRLGRSAEAASLYAEAAGIFHFVGMEEYLSNATGELGYELLDIDGAYPLEALEEGLVEAALSDLAKDISRVFRVDRPIDHGRAVGIIRKAFGSIILTSLTDRGTLLREFSVSVADEVLRPIEAQIGRGDRAMDERFPLLMMDVALSLGFYAAQAEDAFFEEGDVPREIINAMLKTVCDAGDWPRNVMRVVDWLALLLSRRWEFEGVSPERLRTFVQNYDDDIEDWLELTR